MSLNVGEQAFNVLLRFVVDKASADAVLNGTKSLESALFNVEGASGALYLASGRLQEGLDQQVKKTQELQNAWWKTQRVLRASAFVFTTISAAGVGMVTPFIVAAGKYADEMEKLEDTTDPVANKWNALQDKMKESTMSIGRTSAEVLLPLFEKLTDVLDKGAQLLADNPEIVASALKVGAVVASVGVLGALAAGGIKLIVDIKFVLASAQNLLAGEMMQLAAKENFAAAMMMLQKGEYDAANSLLMGPDLLTKSKTTSTASTIASVASSALMIVGALIATAAAVAMVNQLLEASGVNAKIDAAQNDARDNNARVYPGLINDPDQRRIQVELNKAIVEGDTEAIARLNKEMDAAQAQTDGLAAAVENLTGRLRGSKDEADIVAAYTKMREEEVQAEQEYADKRSAIVRASSSKLLGMMGSFLSGLDGLSNDLAVTLGKLAADANKADAEAEAKYRSERGKIVSEGNEEILRMQQDHKDELLKLEMEHNRNIWDLVGERDALGIVEENRRYDEAVSLANQEFNKEVTRRRQETVVRLQELDSQFAQEKAKRQADYLEKVKEEQAKYAKEVEERQKKFAEEMRQERLDAQEKLKAAQEEYNTERQRRRDAFIALVRDLDASLLGEQKLKQAYYNKMLADAERFMAEYKKRLPGGSGTAGSGGFSLYPNHADGDWVSGRINTGERGPEFLLSNATARAARHAIGGQLTQQSLLNRLKSGSQQVVNVNMSNGMTLLQVRRELKASMSDFANDLAVGLGA